MEKLSEANKAMLKNMIQSLEDEERAMDKEFITPKKALDKCCKSSKIKPLMNENLQSENVQKANGSNNFKIKKSGKTEPAIQKKVKTGMESLEDLVKAEDEKSKNSLINQLNQSSEQNFNNDEDQLKSLLEKSILQKRISDNVPVEKQVQIQGSFESYDVPTKIIDGKIQRQIDNKFLLKCVLEWKQRPNGVQPIKSCYDNIELRKYCPQLLLDFYETKIIPKEEIEQQQQQMVVKQKELKEVSNVIHVKQKYEGKQEMNKKGKEIEIESVISISSQESDDNEDKQNQEQNNGDRVEIASEKPMTIQTVSSADIQRKKLMQQINQQEENENDKQRKKLLEIMKQQSEKQQQQPEETEVERYKRQLMDLMKQQESQQEQELQQQEQQCEKESEKQKLSLIDMIRVQSQQQKEVQSEKQKKNTEENMSESDKQKMKLLELMNRQEEELEKENENQEIQAELRPSSAVQLLQDIANNKCNTLNPHIEDEHTQQKHPDASILVHTSQEENIEILEDTTQNQQKSTSNNVIANNNLSGSIILEQSKLDIRKLQEKQLDKGEKEQNRSVNGTQDELLLGLLNKNVGQVETMSEMSQKRLLPVEKNFLEHMELEN